jgi:hypothetical protein
VGEGKEVAAGWLGLATSEPETVHVGDAEFERVSLGLGLGLGLGLTVDAEVIESKGGGLVVITAAEPEGVLLAEAACAEGVDDAEKLAVKVEEGELPTDREGVGVLVAEAAAGAPLGEGDAETSTAMRTALLLRSATAIEPSGKATALDGLLKDAVAPSPLPKPDAPPKSVVADNDTGSIEITRLPPVSARRRRAPAASYQTPAGTRKRAAAPTPSTESCEPPPTNARATPVDVSTALTSKYHVSATINVPLAGSTARPARPRKAAAGPAPLEKPGVVVPASVVTVPVASSTARSRVLSATKSELP